MCMCVKPTRNDESKYGIEGRAPTLAEGDRLIYDEPGRCSPKINRVGGIDYHAFHYRLVEATYGGFNLLVKHGGGEERIQLGYEHTRWAELMAFMPDSDARFLILSNLHSLYTDSRRMEQLETRGYWERAAAEKRIKTRRLPKQGTVKVWIEP